MINHPNAKAVWTTLEGDANQVHPVLVVETDLELNALQPRYDAVKLESLIEAIHRLLAESNGLIESLRIVPIRR
ncbi:MAG: hypothetical protein ACLPKB_16960 [Xanthobacteraceae bacterium]